MNPRFRDEDVTDNRKIDKFPLCRDCRYREKTVERAYRKCQCDKFVYPDYKPQKLYYGKGECEYYEKDDE